MEPLREVSSHSTLSVTPKHCMKKDSQPAACHVMAYAARFCHGGMLRSLMGEAQCTQRDGEQTWRAGKMSGRAACQAASRRSWLAFSSGLLEISDACGATVGLSRMQPETMREACNLHNAS